MQFELEGQLESGFRREVAIGDHQDAIEWSGARDRLGEMERLIEIPRHILHFECREGVAQLGLVIGEARQFACRFSKGDEAKFLVRRQSLDAFAQPLLRFVES